MALRPQHSRVGDSIRVLGTVFIAIHLFLSAWLVIQFEGQYTEGQPAPTKVKALVAIDKEQTLIDVEMENSTSFLLYMVFRDYDEPEYPPQDNQNNSNQDEPGSNASDQDNSSDDDSSQTRNKDRGETVEWLQNGRKVTLASLVLICIAECLVVAGIPLRATLRTILFTGLMACFLVVMPATYVLDLTGDEVASDDDDGGAGDSGGKEDQSTLADETFVSQTEQGSLAHEQTSVENSFLLTGIRFDMMFSGYDLGLVEPENYSAVRSEVPGQNDTDAKSYVEFHSQLDLKYGKNIPSMLVIPLLWFFFPAKPMGKERHDFIASE